MVEHEDLDDYRRRGWRTALLPQFTRTTNSTPAVRQKANWEVGSGRKFWYCLRRLIETTGWVNRQSGMTGRDRKKFSENLLASRRDAYICRVVARSRGRRKNPTGN